MTYSEITDICETLKRVNDFLSRGPGTGNSEAKSEIEIRTTAGSRCYYAFN